MSERRLTVRCPAKVNLSLCVLGRRPDGYHELDTVFQAVGLWDVLSAERAQGIRLDCDLPELPVDERNLVNRAARMLSERFAGGGAGAILHLSKQIPVGGGLGGGSSDAAGALLVCNRLWQLGLGPEELLPLARELGADVPFFLTGGTARGTGRGDRISSLPYAGDRAVLLGLPPFAIATREVFARVAERLTDVGNGVSVSVLSAHKWPQENDFGGLVNGLEEVVFEGWPELRAFRDALLEAGARAALLSGSGSTVYGVFPGSTGSAAAENFVRARFPQWRTVQTRFVRDGVQWDATGGRFDGSGGDA